MSAFTLTPQAQTEQRALEDLERELADAIMLDVEIFKRLEKCNLQPTTRAAALAARSAILVLIAHNIGQEVGQ